MQYALILAILRGWSQQQQKSGWFFFGFSPTISIVLYSHSTLFLHFSKLQTNYMHILASGPEQQAVYFGPELQEVYFGRVIQAGNSEKKGALTS